MQKLASSTLKTSVPQRRETRSTSVRLRQDQLESLEDGTVSPTVRRLLDKHLAEEQGLVTQEMAINILEELHDHATSQEVEEAVETIEEAVLNNQVILE